MGIVIFSGTTEGREISDYLSSKQINHKVCVATASGEAVMEPSEFADIHVGRMDEGELRDFLNAVKSEFATDCLVIDATHPYAKVITDNLKRVCADLQIKYIRIRRESGAVGSFGASDCGEYMTNIAVDYKKHASADECAKDLINEDGNILLATGSKELTCYTQYEQLRDRLFVRVLPTVEAISLCLKAGINEKHIIAMYGPHTKETNVAAMRQFHIKHMVTKESGSIGGFDEKVDAAVESGAKLHIIARPVDEEGISVEELLKDGDLLDAEDGSSVCTQSVSWAPKLILKLVGIGPGSREMMTMQAISALENADVVFGAKRMLECYERIWDGGKAVKFAEYLPEKIIEKLDEILASNGTLDGCSSANYNDNKSENEINVVALFSGDTALFSGASKLYKSLVQWGKCEDVQIISGISSFSAFAAEIGVDLTYAHMESLHGKSTDVANLNKISSLIKQGERVFLLMSGKTDFEVLSGLLPDEYKGEIVVGQNISYPKQVVVRTSAQKLLDDVSGMSEGLFICYVNPSCDIGEDGIKNECSKRTDGDDESNKVDLCSSATDDISNHRIMLAAVASGSGKTTITCGLLAELKRRGLQVKAYKCGPDYIDPMFHTKVIGVQSENLDSFFSDADYINQILSRNGWADISVMEGAMGIYDGILGNGRDGSAYDVAVKTGTPIVLIVDAHGMGATLVSVIKGILVDDENGLIKGIILNRISAHYYENISGQIEKETGVKVLGFVPKLKDVNIDSRHLGLKLPNEIEELEKQLEIVRSELEKTFDVDGLLEIAGVWNAVDAKVTLCEIKEKSDDKRKLPLAVAYDEVFCFYYEENFRLLRDAGVEIKSFSPLHDEKLPEDVAGILLGGGYPELKLAELSANDSMKKSIKSAIESGIPTIAECGGFMYLHDAIETDGQCYEMVGVVPGKCFNTGKLCRFGYVNLQVSDYDIKGHEFHYFDSTNNGEAGVATKPGTGKQWKFGYYDERTGSLMGYPHLYYGSCPKLVDDFVEHMREYRDSL